VNEFKVKMEVTGHPSVCVPAYVIAAPNEDAAIDEGFERAFRELPQFGSFTCVMVEELS
jgi:hypothetical protein